MVDIDSGEKFAVGTEQDQRPWQEMYRDLVEEPHQPGGLRYVGRSIPRNDVVYKILGKAKYLANVNLPDMLHGCFVRSTQPHARILSVNIEAASRVPGVRCIITAEDIPEDRLYIGSLVKDTPVFARDVVRHVGEPIASIAADTLDIARRAATLVKIDYEPLVPVLSPDEALKTGAPLLHPEGNLIADLSNSVGNTETAFEKADMVVEDTYTTEPVEHSYLEAQGGLSFIDSDGVLTLLDSTQYPHYHHKQIAEVTGLPLDRVRVIQTVVGGAFGGKIDNTIECAICLMTLKTGLPVKIQLENEEVFSTTTKRHAMTIRHRLAANSDGRITALDMDILADGGAYSSYSLIVAGRCIVHAALPYDVPNVRARIRTTFTNNITAGAMRSFGIVKLAFATESQIDKLAHGLGISPIEIRRRNAMETGRKTVTGQKLENVGLIKTLDAIEPIYEERCRAIASAPVKDGLRRGVGVASLGYGIGYSGVGNPSTARIEVTVDGLIIANCGTPDIGPGSDTVLAQIVAESASISMGRIRVVSGDSTKTDDSGPTSASRTTYFSGNAAALAGQDFKEQFTAQVAAKLGYPHSIVRLHDDHIIINNEAMTFVDACAEIGEDISKIKAYGVFDPDTVLDFDTFKGDPYPAYTYATQMAEIEIDTETGQVNVPRYWAAHDAGRIVNPMGAEGQIEGGVVMGLGMALWEKIVCKGGFIQNPSLREYQLPGTKDVPEEITTIFVDSYDKSGPYGAKGVAEASLIPVPAAVAAGINNAIGVRMNRLPMDAEALVDALDQHNSGNGSDG
ncbi:MAG: xanthine dehydrogenase family protein molybdopterin-binding subunit [Pseudomonadota bacterium]|nr:xanthine dehydrogenase family protein molybdopterin-binding subunit [Pseudomonadota bacterium]